ncbi:unnamed protein product, partial [Discosporangium mesarthrocarpum]
QDKKHRAFPSHVMSDMELFAAATSCDDPSVARIFLDGADHNVNTAVNHYLNAKAATGCPVSPSDPPPSSRGDQEEFKREKEGIDSIKTQEWGITENSSARSAPGVQNGEGGVGRVGEVERTGYKRARDGEVTSRICFSQPPQHDHPRWEYSRDWLLSVERCRRDKVLFSDSEFPPEPKSLDGRKGATEESRSGSERIRTDGSIVEVDGTVQANQCVQCRCNIPAKVVCVRKAGPNQGKLFYGCVYRKCSFFRWATDAPHTSQALSLVWERLTPPRFRLVTNRFRPEDVLQGSVGDCWFLAGLSVVSERSDLINRV